MTTTDAPLGDAPLGDAPPGDRTANDSDATAGRRRVVQLSGAAIAVGLAGCSDLGLGDGGDSDHGPPSSTPDEQGTQTEGATARESDDPTATETEDATNTETAEPESEEATATETDEDIHEHGHLFLDIDGERHPFSDPKYYPQGEHPDAEASERFHFHDYDDEDNLWHMHGERLTLAGALGDLPGIEYVSNEGAHVINFEGETYEDGRDGTTVEIRQGETPLDPIDYELQDGDEINIEITTGDSSN